MAELDPQQATPDLPPGFVLEDGIPVRQKAAPPSTGSPSTSGVPAGFILQDGIPVKDTRPRIGAGKPLPPEDPTAGHATKPYNLSSTPLDIRDPAVTGSHVLRTAAEGAGMMFGGESGGLLAKAAEEGALATSSLVARGLTAAGRLALRMFGAAGGAAAGHVIGGAVEQAGPSSAGPPPSVESTLHAAKVGGLIEAASAPVSAVVGGAVRAVQAGRQASAAGAPVIPAVTQSVKETFAPVTRTIHAGIDTLFGPPKVYGAADIAGHAIPPVNVSEAMGGTGTAGQVRDSSTLTGTERVIRGSLGGGGPLDAAINAGEQKLQADAHQIIGSLGVPVPTSRQAGETLLTPPRVEAEQASEATATQLADLHHAIIQQADAHATSAAATEAAQQATTAGAMDKAAALRQQADAALQTAQHWDTQATELRKQVYGSAGPVRTEEEASQIVHRLNEQAATRADDAVDEMYRETDAQGAALGKKAVSLQSLFDTANAAGKTSTVIERRLNPSGAGFPGRVADATQVPVEPGAAPVNVAESLRATRGTQPSGQPKEIPQEALDALHQAISAAQVTDGQLATDEISFTQARRIRSRLGSIAYRAQSTNPTLALWAGVFKDTLGDSMEQAAKAAGSNVWTTYRAADALFKKTQAMYQEGLLADLATKEPHLAVQFLKGRSGADLTEVLSGEHLGDGARQALRGALVDQVFKDPATGAYRTGKSLSTALKQWSPEQLTAIFGAEGNAAIRATPLALRGSERATAEARQLVGTATGGGTIRRAEGQALTEATGAMQAEQATVGARAKAVQAREDYFAALTKNSRATADTLNAMNPETALAQTITKTTDSRKLAETQAKVTQLLGPEAWAGVQARWTADLLDLREKDSLLARVTAYPPEVVKLMIPDTATRNKVYQLGRVFEHLAKRTPEPRYYGMASQALGALSDVIAFHNVGGAAERAAAGVGAAHMLARVLANDQAGAALIAGLKAGATDAPLAARLLTPVVAFMRREGMIGLPGGPPRVGPGPGAASPSGPAGSGTPNPPPARAAGPGGPPPKGP